MDAITPEERLVEAARGGSLDAFEALVRLHQGRVFTTAYHLLGDEAEADDVAQEVWVRAYRALPRFRLESRFATWLYRITVNESMTALKRRRWRFGGRKEDITLDAAEEGGVCLASETPGPRKTLEGKEMARAFRTALGRLPEKQRLAVTLVLLQDLSHREAGQVMGVAEKTVSWHLFKARERLTEDLGPMLRR